MTRIEKEAPSYAKLSVQVLNDNCWQNCEDFEPLVCNTTYATNLGGSCIYSRHYQCGNLDKCKRLSLYLEKRGDTE